MDWRIMPAYKKTLLSLAGLVSGISTVYGGHLPVLYIICLISLLISLRINKTILFFSAFLITGALSTYLNIRIPANHLIKTAYDTINAAEGRISSVKQSDFSSSYIVDINKVFTSTGESKNIAGKILLNATAEKNPILTYGVSLKIQGLQLRKIAPPKNPYEFDYRQFMKRNKIYMEAKAETIVVTSGQNPSIPVFLYNLRKFLSGRLKQYFLYFPEEKELVETVTIGKEKIPSFLKEAGIRSGTYHMMVISGSNIAFIILFLKILLLPFMKIHNTRPKLFPCLSLLCIWFYAGLTGFNVPVVRAVLMFSFFYAGDLLERDIDGINSIITAAIVLLIINPCNLFEASFHLSFVATAGIILFWRRFNILHKNFFQSMMLTSFAAQIAVFPLLLYHFGLFYPVGLINNFIFLPLTGVILILFLLFLLLPFIFFHPLKILLSFFLKGITVSDLFSPSLAVTGSLLFMIFFYSACFFVFYVPRKKSITIILSATASLSLLCGIVISNMRINKPDRLYFFSFSRPSAVVLFDNRSVAFLSDNYKRQEIQEIFVPFLRKERTSCISGLFYTETSFNHHGTLNALSGRAKPRRVYEPESIKDSSVFPYMNSFYYQSAPGMFEFVSEGSVVPAGAFVVELLGEENGCVSYVVRKGKTSILIAPYIGESIAEKIRNRHFSIAFIGNIKKSKGVMRNIDTINYLYLILPAGYKKFKILPAPMAQIFYLSNSSVELVFDKSPFGISYLYE